MARIQVENDIIEVPDDTSPAEMDAIANHHAAEATLASHVRPTPAAAAPVPNPEDFAVHTGHDMLNIPADKTNQAYKEMGQQALNGAKVIAPTAVGLAVPALLPEMAAGAEAGLGTRAALFAGRTAANALGGAAGQATSEALDAAQKGKVPDLKEAGQRVLKAGETAGAFSAGAEVGANTLGMAFNAVRHTVRNGLDFFANAAQGTAKTAGKVPTSAIKPFTEEHVAQFAGDVSKTVDDAKKAAGAKIDEAFKHTDADNPEGVIPFTAIRDKLQELRGKLRSSAPIPGTDKPTTDTIDKLEGFLQDWREAPHGRDKLTLTEAKDLLDRAREGVKFEATAPGAAGAGTRRVMPFSGWLRSEIGKANPSAAQALDHYGKLVDDADFLKSATGITSGEQVTPELVKTIEGKLKGFLKTGEITDKILDRVMTGLGRPDLGRAGQGLAVSQQLSGPGAGSAGGLSGFVANTVRGATAPFVRAGFGPTARLAEALRVPEGAGTLPGKVAGGLIQALSKKKEK